MISNKGIKILGSKSMLGNMFALTQLFIGSSDDQNDETLEQKNIEAIVGALPPRLTKQLETRELNSWGASSNLFLALISLSLAAANADGDISEKEVEIIDELYDLARHNLPISVLREVHDLKKNPPTLEEAFVYLKKIKNQDELFFIETILDRVAKADGEFCFKEKQLIDHFRIESGIAQAVPVVATMSSGKSTLINALIGSSLLPVENQACTATILKIENQTDIQNAHGRKISSEVGVSDWQPVCAEELRTWNKQELSGIELLGNFPNIQNKQGHTIIYDTPGPNNSMNKSHGEITKDILQKINFGHIVIVLNSEQFAIDDELALLEELIPLANKRVRFLFALNKFDSFDLEAEPVLQFISRVRRMLNGTNFKRPILIPTMSKTSLGIRELLSNEDSLASWSRRRKTWILNEIDYIDSNRDSYLKSLCHTKTNEKIFTQTQERYVNVEEGNIILGENNFSKIFLKKIDLLTGIPLLEAYIEKTLSYRKL